MEGKKLEEVKEMRWGSGEREGEKIRRRRRGEWVKIRRERERGWNEGKGR